MRLLRTLKRLLGGGAGGHRHEEGMHARSRARPVDAPASGLRSLGAVDVPPGVRERAVAALARRCSELLAPLFGGGDVDGDDVREFLAAEEGNPAREHRSRSTSDGLCLWLWLLARRIAPDTIVESGVYVGRSLWLLRRACPDADLHAFDPELGHLLFRDASIAYHEEDWAGVPLEAGTGFCYFDDHIDNARRIVEAHERGFRHLVFDQCASVGTLPRYRYPGMPTARILDRDVLAEGEAVEWWWGDRRLRYEHADGHAGRAGELIEELVVLPPLDEWLEGPADACYVRLAAEG